MISPATLLRAVRAPSLTAGAMPALVAAATASFEGVSVAGGRLALALVGLVSLQAGVNLLNDYFDDASGLDADPEFADNPFPLGSRVIQEGALSPRGVLAAAAVCFAVGAACGLVLDRVHPGHVVLWLGTAGAALGTLYTAPPLRIAYRGAGEPITFALFGPVAGMGSYYVFAGHVTPLSALTSTLVGLLAMAILFIHHFPQHDADKRHGKRTPIVRLGRVRAGKLVPMLLATPYVLVTAAVVAGGLPAPTLAFWLTAPLAVSAARKALSRSESPKHMAVAVAQVLGVHFLGGIALAGGLWLAAWV
ncbi:MAG: prenyltransferase [Proteobacteria bacterium]|nr:prenyltransferase [Pseudomonadota bacterium]